MKLSKQQTKLHSQAEDLISSDKILDLDDKLFIIENWNPESSNNITETAAFFTPYGLAEDCVISFFDEPAITLDLCAGIGILSFAYKQKIASWQQEPQLTCVEINPDYVRVGKRILPEADWILGDVFSLYQDGTLKNKKFNGCISNPPFGVIPKRIKRPKNIIASTWEYAIAEIALDLTDEATMILPQGCLPWKFSGRSQKYELVENEKYEKWSEKTGIILESGISCDTSFHEFKSTKITVEIVDAIKQKKPKAEVIAEPSVISKEKQLVLF
jgi:predicted RNA methylase